MVFFFSRTFRYDLNTVYLIVQILVTISVYILLDCFFLRFKLGLLSL